MTFPVTTADVVQRVETYVDSEHRDAAKYDNRTPLDESGVFSLHMLAAEVYALAWQDATRAAEERARKRLQRVEAAHRTALQTTLQGGTQ